MREIAVLGCCALALISLPGIVHAAGPSATGGGEIHFDIGIVVLEYQASLNAVTLGSGDVSGHFNYKLNAPLDFFPGGKPFLKSTLSCLELDGEDIATVSGLTIEGLFVNGLPIPEGLCWIGRFVDNGQGQNADPDLGSFISILPCDDPDEFCRDSPPLPAPGLLPVGVLVNGGLQIRP